MDGNGVNRDLQTARRFLLRNENDKAKTTDYVAATTGVVSFSVAMHWLVDATGRLAIHIVQHPHAPGHLFTRHC